MDLAAERMDVAFRWSSVHGQSTAFEHKVADIAWMLVGAPSYLSANGHPGTPDEAAGHALLGYWRDAADDWWELERRDERAQVRARSRYHVDNPEVVLEACLQGLGIAMLPDYLCADALIDGRLVRVLPDWTPVTRFGTEIIALIMPDRARIRRHRVLVDFLVDRRSGAV
jgi:DNA-binding transcriptional LysR family regulator